MNLWSASQTVRCKRRSLCAQSVKRITRTLVSIRSSNRERSNFRTGCIRPTTLDKHTERCAFDRRLSRCLPHDFRPLGEKSRGRCTSYRGVCDVSQTLCKISRGACDVRRGLCKSCRPLCDVPIAHCKSCRGVATQHIPLCKSYIGLCERAQAAVRRAMGPAMCDKSRAHSALRRNPSLGRMQLLRWFRGTSPVLCSSPGAEVFPHACFAINQRRITQNCAHRMLALRSFFSVPVKNGIQKLDFSSKASFVRNSARFSFSALSQRIESGKSGQCA